MQNNRLFVLITFLVLSLGLSACGNSGLTQVQNNTEVHLEQDNFKIVAINVTGSAESSYLLGASYSWGMATQTVGLIPLKGTKTLYNDARKNLWDNYKDKYGSVEGKKLALINVQYDAATTNYLVYTKARVIVTADVIAFE